MTLADTKTSLEIAAYACGVLFLAAKLAGGQANAGMEVSIDLARAEVSSKPELDNLSVVLKLKRPDLGRLELDDVVIEVSDATDKSAKPMILRSQRVVLEHLSEGGQLKEPLSSRGLTLPPSDATQIAYFAQVKRGVPLLIDATILATRTGLWVGRPQWRASAIALPVDPASAPNKLKSST